MVRIFLDKLKEEKKFIDKTLKSMETYSGTDEYHNKITDEERDLFHEHFDTLVSLQEILDKRLDYYNKD